MVNPEKYSGLWTAVARYQRCATEAAGDVWVGAAVMQEDTELGRDRGGSGWTLTLAARCCVTAGSAKEAVATVQ